jgi:protein-tyrosine phosphatase
MVLRMVSKGCVVQVTAGALLGQWGQAARRTAEWLLERDALHVIASDAHDVQHRPPVLSAARDLVARWCDLELAEILVERNPSAIVHGQALPYFPVPRPGAMHAGGH